MNTEIKPSQAPDAAIGHAVNIVCAYVSKNQIPITEVAGFIRSVHAVVGGLSSQGASEQASVSDKPPAVPIKKSVQPDFIVCLEDGKRLKMLKRYLRSHYDMSPEQYRAKWGLPADYPMVAPSYAQQRSDFAKSFGLGQRRPPPPKMKAVKAGKVTAGDARAARENLN